MTTTAIPQNASTSKEHSTQNNRALKRQHIHAARRLMREQHSGVLSTTSLSMKGFPFGSVIPFLMTESGDLVIYASDIAQHSRNMKAQEKVSVCVFDSKASDSQANARVTVMAYAQADGVSEELKQQYFNLFPQAKAYINAHDFRFYLLHLERVRYIGGFGDIFWFSQEEWSDCISLSRECAEVIAHMEQDHAHALIDIAKSYFVEKNQNMDANLHESCVKMLSCYAEGFHFMLARDDSQGLSEYKVYFVPFLQHITANYDLRMSMVDLTKSSRNINHLIK
ncbi:HugZ family pyridoxamine 5'-phosphate oxidase [Agaribacter flavus]|uniref:HugZ family protein n=1 Tax=Agaribacter flavus TaxID=1902781 RepID=A0ABV7FUF1_9ALTE